MPSGKNALLSSIMRAAKKRADVQTVNYSNRHISSLSVRDVADLESFFRQLDSIHGHVKREEADRIAAHVIAVKAARGAMREVGASPAARRSVYGIIRTAVPVMSSGVRRFELTLHDVHRSGLRAALGSNYPRFMSLFGVYFHEHALDLLDNRP